MGEMIGFGQARPNNAGLRGLGLVWRAAFWGSEVLSASNTSATPAPGFLYRLLAAASQLILVSLGAQLYANWLVLVPDSALNFPVCEADQAEQSQ